MSGNFIQNFKPYETVPLNAGTTTSSVAFKLPQSAGCDDCMVYNGGSVVAFVGFGNGSSTSVLPGTTGTLNCTPVAPGATVVLNKNQNTVNGSDTCSAIVTTGTAQLYFTAGTGS